MTTISISMGFTGCGGSNNSHLEDPLTGMQWYLNGGEHEVYANINYKPGRYSGQGVNVAIVDDGVDINHIDLAGNISDLNVSYLPPGLNFSDAPHGTAIAGLIAARRGNGTGGHGIAYNATLSAFNVMKIATVDNIADALILHLDTMDIYNNSWGDFNSWGAPFTLREEISASLETGIKLGRDGLGAIYVFSAGNGAETGGGITIDNTNYSGLVNNFYTIPICAVTSEGVKAHYSESGATLVTCAPSSGGEKSIFTTDVSGSLGYNDGEKESLSSDYTGVFGGTSAAAPMATGAIALMLEANRDLTWRDVRIILALSATPIDANNTGWIINGAGLPFHHDYGFGLINIKLALEIAEEWPTNLPLKIVESPEIIVNQIIPSDDLGLQSTQFINSNLSIEFIDVYFDAPDHQAIGQLRVELTSPSGTTSILAEPHFELFEGLFRYKQWRFGSNAHLGETSEGEWILRVYDDEDESIIGSLQSWKLKVYGTERSVYSHLNPKRLL